MNSNYTNNPIFPNQSSFPNQQFPNQNGFNIQQNNLEDFEQSYIENILRLNRGKKVEVYSTFPDANEWRDKIFSGIIEESGRDHLILSNPATGDWYLILMIYINYIKFDERINYSKGFVPENIA